MPVPIKQKDRSLPAGGSLICIVACFVCFINMVSRGFGGCGSIDPIGCSISPWVLFLTLGASILFLVFSVQQTIVGATKKYIKLVGAYIALLVISTLSIVAMNGGAVSALLRDTKLRCDLMDVYRASPCYIELALSKNDLSYCRYTREYDQCFGNFKVKASDAAVCKGNGWCIRAVAKITKDVKLCETIAEPNNKAWCYGELADATKDLSLCKYVTDDVRVPYCYGYEGQ